MCAAVKTFGIGKFDLNPRGNLWAKDESKLGQKLLSKMGWSEGKGLGKNENGITEGIKVRMKVGHSGVGFTEKLPLGLENDTYNAVLESLNRKFKTDSKTTKVGKSVNGLEQRCQQFKNRLHYQKFVRGKDVGRYSEKDMNGIFVKRKLDVEPVAFPLKSNVTNVDPAPAEISAPKLLPTFKSQLSMKDYFAMKLKKKSKEVQPSNPCTLGSQDVKNSSHESGTSTKKRKRELKNNSKASKKLKSQSLDILEDDGTTLKPDINETEELSESEIHTEVKKEKKCRKSKLTEKLGGLKSCLRKKFTASLWFNQEAKEVSFNDSVSYKIIENVLNGDDVEDFACTEMDGHPVKDGFEKEILEDGECPDDESEPTAEDNNEEGLVEKCMDSQHPNHIDNDTLKEYEEPSCTRTAVDSTCDDLDRPKCFDLPKCDNSNYNTWLESQRIAIKMKLYKNMVKKIRKNPVLRTSNLIDIKGYGNWGF